MEMLELINKYNKNKDLIEDVISKFKAFLIDELKNEIRINSLIHLKFNNR